MAPTIYLATSGSYYDYRVDAAFSTKEKAEAYVKMAGECDSSVEEYVIDEAENDAWFDLFQVELNGDGVERKRLQRRHFGKSISHADVHCANSPTRAFFGHSTESFDMALKLAAECRQAWLRETCGTGKAVA